MSLTVAPVWKLVPARFVILTLKPDVPLFGVILVIVGSGPEVVLVAVGVGVGVAIETVEIELAWKTFAG
jgi:hypothetical protein